MGVEIEDHSKEVIKAKDEAVARALEMIGLQCEKYAKFLCPTDTSLLKNSITHAVSGEGTAISTYHADKAKGGATRIGRYAGVVGNSKEEAVYIGTNVEYAPYVEYGTKKMDAQPFIKPAVNNHLDEYKRIAETCLRG